MERIQDAALFTPLSQIASYAQQRVKAEIQAFEAEKAKTEEWKEEHKRTQQKQAGASQPPAEPSVPKKLAFSLDELDDDDDDPLHANSAPPAAARSSEPSAGSAQRHAAAAQMAAPEAPAPAEPWKLRLEVLLTIMDQEASAADSSSDAPPGMPSGQLVEQLRQLGREMDEATERRAEAARPRQSAAAPSGAGATSVGALQQQVEHLSEALAKAQLNARQKAETHRRTMEELEARVQAAEMETLDRMRIVAESVEAETEAQSLTTQLTGELAAVRTKAGGRIKELIASNKALEEEVARLRELEELNGSKITALEASFMAADNHSMQKARDAQKQAAKQQEELTYARAIVLRYLELESQHEALFPALASAFRFTQHEVQRIQTAQQRHAHESSLWGRALGAGSTVLSVVREVAQETNSQQR